jgi:hypothetical protein
MAIEVEIVDLTRFNHTKMVIFQFAMLVYQRVNLVEK